MAEIRFYHPNADPPTLSVQTGADKIEWSYGLNTQTIPTYGGEVVQILSAYVDDITISGTISSYQKMEQIFKWFLTYFQVATQGNGVASDPRFVEKPVVMTYAERGWTVKFKPTSLPGYRLGTEVVAPTWQISGSVVEGDQEMNAATLEAARVNGFDFNTLHGGIGYDEDNPFTDPAAKDSNYDPRQYAGDITDFYTSLVPSYLEGDFDQLFNGGFYGSRPYSTQQGEDGDQKKPGGKNKNDGKDKGKDDDKAFDWGSVFGG